MKKILKGLGVFVLSAAMVGVFALSAMAQAPTGRQYKVDLLFDLSMQNIDPEGPGDVDVDTFLIAGSIGFFLNDMFEVGPEISYNKFEMEDVDGDKQDTSGWSLGGIANAHFDTGSEITPYVGLNLGFSNLDIMDESESALYYGVQAGLDYFLNENVSINPELRYTMATYDFLGIDMDVTDMHFMIGFAVHF